MVASTSSLGLNKNPILYLDSAHVLSSNSVLYTAVHEAKAALLAYRSQYQLSRLHVFFRTPSVFAMALGHRLSGLGSIQIYDWTGSGYHPAASLGP